MVKKNIKGASPAAVEGAGSGGEEATKVATLKAKHSGKKHFALTGGMVTKQMKYVSNGGRVRRSSQKFNDAVVALIDHSADRLVTAALAAMEAQKCQTLLPRHVDIAARLILPGELCKHAVSHISRIIMQFDEWHAARESARIAKLQSAGSGSGGEGGEAEPKKAKAGKKPAAKSKEDQGKEEEEEQEDEEEEEEEEDDGDDGEDEEPEGDEEKKDEQEQEDEEEDAEMHDAEDGDGEKQAKRKSQRSK